MTCPYPIVDLFAGPGGLGEGFSGYRSRSGESAFEIRLSVEKDAWAHQTLELRAFFRQFPERKAPAEYYHYLLGKKGITREVLFGRYPAEANKARREAICAALGGTEQSFIDARIAEAVSRHCPWVLIGGPPCQAYSLVGRSRIIGGKGLKEYESDHRHMLYREYLKVLARHRPTVFVMENVKGLLSSKLKESRMILQIMRDLERPRLALRKEGSGNVSGPLEYRLYPLTHSGGQLPGVVDPRDFLVRAEQFGVPQARHRLIIIGIRADMSTAPSQLIPKKGPNIEDVLKDLPRIRSGLSKSVDSADEWVDAICHAQYTPWIDDHAMDHDVRSEIIKLLSGFAKLAPVDRGGEFVPGRASPGYAKRWYCDPRLKGFCNHSSRGHIMGDLHRYLYAAAFALVNGRSPDLSEFPAALLPAHKNVRKALSGSMFGDRFRVQVAGRVSTTITSHIAKDGHYFIHYDPTQCRSLTVREAARLQTFPDNYFFEGPRTEQYKQVGNAVPPLLALQIAEIVYGILK